MDRGERLRRRLPRNARKLLRSTCLRCRADGDVTPSLLSSRYRAFRIAQRTGYTSYRSMSPSQRRLMRVLLG
jgi:hypothetical protein